MLHPCLWLKTYHFIVACLGSGGALDAKSTPQPRYKGLFSLELTAQSIGILYSLRALYFVRKCRQHEENLPWRDRGRPPNRSGLMGMVCGVTFFT